MTTWRCVQILEDGRWVYISKRGKIDPFTDSEKESFQRSHAAGGSECHYLKNLACYGSLLELGVPREDLLAVTGNIWQPATEPLFTQARLLGNLPPCDP